MANSLNILAFGSHPDDIELGCAGTLLAHVAMGKRVGIVDLTRGEMGTRGTPEIRDEETKAASKILGVTVRENLQFADGFFVNDKEHQLEVIRMIRKYRPQVVLANALSDRHPDHGRAARLVADACYLSGLAKIKMDGLEAFRPKAVYNYIQFLPIVPDIVVDISDFHEKKMEAILAHKSQFYNPESQEPATIISNKDFMDFVNARALDLGKQIGVRYGEGFTANRYIGVNDLVNLL